MSANQMDVFAGLDDEDKAMLIQMGIESFLRARKFHCAGLSTLRGAMYYVREDSPALCDVMLHALNGDEQNRKRLNEFMESSRCQRIDQAFSSDWCGLFDKPKDDTS